jgi:predicted Zn-dependent protease
VGTLEDLISDVDHGLYLETPASWSLDDRRLNCHFSTEMARVIEKGRLGDYRRGASFQFQTPSFWGKCRQVGGPKNWRLRGFASCAKGEPLQLAHVSHGAPPILVPNIAIERA